MQDRPASLVPVGNLVPERRMNKNGVMVTKHVRPGAPMRSAASAPPPPTSPDALPSGLREALKGRGGRTLTVAAGMEPGLRSRFEAMLGRRSAFVSIVGSAYRFDDFVGDLVSVKDPQLRAAAIGIVAAVDDDALEWTVDLDVCHGLTRVPELAEHIDDLTAAPKPVVLGAQNLAEYVHWLRQSANTGNVILARGAPRIADRELEKLIYKAEGGIMSALSDWAFTDARALAGPEATKFFWRYPEQRRELGVLLDLYVGGDLDRERLIIEHWDRRDEITEMLNGDVESTEAIRKVLDGEVPGALASGAL